MTIKIYSKPMCPHCDTAKRLLSEWGYEYEEINVSMIREGYDFLIERGHRTVPQIYYTDTQFVAEGASGLAALGKQGFQQLITAQDQ